LLVGYSSTSSLKCPTRFEPSQEARARATAEGNTRPEDLIAIYRKRTTINSSGKETESHARYFVVDSVEALGKFGPDAWERVVCVMTTGQAWQFKPYKWNEPITLFHHGEQLAVDSLSTTGDGDSVYLPLLYSARYLSPAFPPVKGIYVSWSNDPPNTKIKDWNVTELKVRAFTLYIAYYSLPFPC
jgi:parafibromin